MGLQRDPHTGKNRRQADDRQRVKAHVDDLAHKIAAVKGRRQAVVNRLGDKNRKFPKTGDKSNQRFTLAAQKVFGFS